MIPSNERSYKLVLHPIDAHSVPTSPNQIENALEKINFINGSYDANEENCFLVGESFLQYVTFMGCSPQIELEPPEPGSRNFCHVQFSVIYNNPQFRFLENQAMARCAVCKRRISEWSSLIEIWKNDFDHTQYKCKDCGHDQTLYDFKWRHTAGFARFFIDIYSIYPQEGIPADQLLITLRQATGQPWDYFYTDQ
jgi:hypothetical protein